MPNVLSYTVGIVTSPFTAGLANAQKAVGGFQKTVSISFGTIAKAAGLLGASFAAFQSFSGAAASLREVFESGKELQTTATITGQTVGTLLQLQKAFHISGLEGEEVEGMLIRMQKSLGGVSEDGVPTVEMFSRLRLRINELKQMAAPEAMEKIGRAIGSLPDQSSKANAAMAIFGHEGARILALFANPKAFEEARAELGSYASLMQKNAALFTKITNDLHAVGGIPRKFFAGVASELGPALLPLLDQLKSIDLTSAGQKLGALGGRFLDTARHGLELIEGAFQSGRLGELVGLSLNVGFSNSVDWLKEKLVGLWKGLSPDSNNLFGGLDNLFDGFADLLAGRIKKAIVEGLRSVQVGGMHLISDSDAFGATMQAKSEIQGAKAKINQGLNKIDQGALGNALGFVKGAFDGLTASSTEAKERFEALRKSLQTAADLKWEPVNQQAEQAKLPAINLGDGNHQEVFTDRLRKIGGMFGQAGGPAGQRAAQDTARNTGLIADSIAKFLSENSGPRRDARMPATF